MARRKGRSLGRAEVIAAAKACVYEEGPDALNVNRLASRLGIRTPSLYNHVTGADDIRRAVALEIFRALNEHVIASVAGCDDLPSFLRSMGAASLEFARSNVNAYLFLMQTPLNYAEGEPAVAWDEGSQQLIQRLRDVGIEGDETRHAVSYIQSVVSGFVRLELRGSLPSRSDDSFQWVIDRVIFSLEALHPRPALAPQQAASQGAVA